MLQWFSVSLNSLNSVKVLLHPGKKSTMLSPSPWIKRQRIMEWFCPLKSHDLGNSAHFCFLDPRKHVNLIVDRLLFIPWVLQLLNVLTMSRQFGARRVINVQCWLVFGLKDTYRLLRPVQSMFGWYLLLFWGEHLVSVSAVERSSVDIQFFNVAGITLRHNNEKSSTVISNCLNFHWGKNIG